MFEKFKKRFEIFDSIKNSFIEMKEIPFKYVELLTELGGISFNKGLYSIHTFEDSAEWALLLGHYFPGYKGEVLPFAKDWWGRHYCVPKKGYEAIYVFDPIDLKDYVLEENLSSFLNLTLAEDLELLDNNLFQEVLRFLKIDGVIFEKCIGYKIPLFLNGSTDLSNYEITDLKVYWETQYQIFFQLKEVPDGTQISNATIILPDKK